LTQERAIEELSNSKKYIAQVQLLLEERKRLEVQLKSTSFVDVVYPSDANFLLVRVDDAAKRYHQLVKEGVVIRNRSNQQGCAKCLRFSVGTAEENKKLISILNRLS
jgi:histidinol-phosphate aminotransferase